MSESLTRTDQWQLVIWPTGRFTTDTKCGLFSITTPGSVLVGCSAIGRWEQFEYTRRLHPMRAHPRVSLCPACAARQQKGEEPCS